MLRAVTAQPLDPDRRQRRRQETIEEVLETAAVIMAEQGVAGLSVGEVARRMGIRPPSLYGYFPSKHALYDALFARGAQLVLDHVRARTAATGTEDRPLDQVLLDAAEAFVGWSVANAAYSQLLFWRPVPGFTPSEEAYAPAVEMVGLSRSWFADLQERGRLRATADLDEVQRDWTVLCSGVISQQLSNAPGETVADGRFVAALPALTSMFARHYGAHDPDATSPARRSEARRARSHRPDR